MSNPARDLLNYVDDHKTEMKDDTYKGIVDRLAPINKALDDTKRSLYKAIFLISEFDDTDDGGELSMSRKEFKVYLSDEEVNLINKRLETVGVIICVQHHFNVKKYQGIHYISEFRDSLIKEFNKVIIDVDTNTDTSQEPVYKKLPYFYSNDACLVRIVKV